MRKREPARHIDLDLFAHLLKVFADTPWLHYGLWLDGEMPSFPALRRSQERYVERLVALLPPAGAAVLDIGGGTGALADHLAALGYEVEMLTPSATQVAMAREKLGDRVPVHQARLEAFESPMRYDVCLFSESFQYIRLNRVFPALEGLLAPGGRVVITDCFRTDAWDGGRAVGGGHRWTDFISAVGEAGYDIVANEDVTALAAPTIALDRLFYREAVTPILGEVRGMLQARRPALNWIATQLYRLLVRRAERDRIAARLKAEYRTPELFLKYNTYRFVALAKRAG